MLNCQTQNSHVEETLQLNGGNRESFQLSVALQRVCKIKTF